MALRGLLWATSWMSSVFGVPIHGTAAFGCFAPRVVNIVVGIMCILAVFTGENILCFVVLVQIQDEGKASESFSL